jgi:hypothetical protein
MDHAGCRFYPKPFSLALIRLGPAMFDFERAQRINQDSYWHDQRRRAFGVNEVSQGFTLDGSLHACFFKRFTSGGLIEFLAVLRPSLWDNPSLSFSRCYQQNLGYFISSVSETQSANLLLVE